MRTILHLDLDAFFCAVEELSDASLKGKPFAVGGRPEARGVVSSCSYAARALGIHSAMPMRLALQLCPQLQVVPPDHRRYSELSGRVMQYLHDLSPLVEPISIDEAFVDLSDLAVEVESTARQLQQKIWDELHLPCSIGIASNKLVAKIATDVGKKAARGPDYPRALTIVPSGKEAEFLAPLPSSMLWGVGKKTEASLAALGIHTIGDIARWPEKDLEKRFGLHGHDLARHALGLDERPVVTEHEVKSISQEVTFAQDVKESEQLEATLKTLSEHVGRSLRQEHLAGSTVKLKLRWADFTTLTRQVTLPACTDQGEEIYAAALELLHKARPPGKYVRLIGVGVSSLGAPVRQLALWGQAAEKQRKLQAVLDELQDKYGKKVIGKGK
ncbi:MAG: DNA polymerase IV [Anaerolineales bacterium]|jgi:DNA polymerase-4|nr:DNA polymerase IV [Anaerolineales bacterium]